MATKDQLRANRANARKSTGPRTEAGKERARLNALRHGLTATTVLIAGESEDDFQELLDQFADDLMPVGASEEMLVQQLALAAWRLRRAVRIESGVFAHLLEIAAARPGFHQVEELTLLGVAYATDAKRGDALSKLSRYETTLFRRVLLVHLQLERLQANRCDPDPDP